MKPISRRGLIQAASAVGLGSALNVGLAHNVPARAGKRSPSRIPGNDWKPEQLATPVMRDPIWVYDNWSAYAEGHPTYPSIAQTEELAMRQLRQVLRLKDSGIHFEYYMMNAYWMAPDSGYRQWRTPHWPKGPDQWISECWKHGIRPGLWFATNSLWDMSAVPQWQDSLVRKADSGWHFDSLSMHEGGFLADFFDVLEHYYQRGIRLFELDGAHLDAVTSQGSKKMSALEIRNANVTALSNAMRAFRIRHPDAMFVAFNDFGGDIDSTTSAYPFKKPVDLRWLEVFDTLYCGDVRVSDVPQASFWRSVDLYNDHMVRRYEQSGVPLERIDPFFTLSSSWFGYHREKRAWKSMLLLTAARGSWKKTIYGSLDLLSDDDLAWFNRVQQMYASLAALGRTKTFGGIPGEAQPYGYGSVDAFGSVYTVVNPAQEFRSISLPLLSSAQNRSATGRVLFRDAGFAPDLVGSEILLGPGQMAVVGYDRYAEPRYALGIEEDVIIPRKLSALDVPFRPGTDNTIETTCAGPSKGGVRVLFHHYKENGEVFRHKPLGKITAQQGGKAIPVETQLPYKDDAGFGGISWAVGELRPGTFAPGAPITFNYSLKSDTPVVLKGKAFSVEY